MKTNKKVIFESFTIDAAYRGYEITSNRKDMNSYNCTFVSSCGKEITIPVNLDFLHQITTHNYNMIKMEIKFVS